MDRNVIYLLTASGFRVALRKESVDRNLSLPNFIRRCLMSLSARRAWIEIYGCYSLRHSASRRSPQGERG